MKINIKDLEKWQDPEYCMAAVQQNGYALQYVHAPSEAVCLAAVQQDSDALQLGASNFTKYSAACHYEFQLCRDLIERALGVAA